MKWTYIPLMISSIFIGSAAYPSIQQVSLEEAQKAALATIGKNADSRLLSTNTNNKIRIVNQLTELEHTLMYEVVFEDNSAVLLSGSKACLPVLGHYTVSEDNQSVFADETPGGLKDLIEVYRRQIEACFRNDTITLHYRNEWQELQANEKQIPLDLNRTSSVIVPPLLSSKWGQDWSNNKYNNDIDYNAYNYYVSETSNKCDSKYSNRCPAGCTSVAMAQIMRYWAYPVYYAQPIGFATWFDWCNMPDSLDTYSPNYEKERHAIASLIKTVGEAAQTNYCYMGGCQSMATIWNARQALEQNFGYNSQAHVDWRWAHTESDWIQKIKNDLNNGRPVMYCALDITETAGHTFVIDGYDSEGKFHINWGYRGKYQDSYFSINKLTPYENFEYTSAEHALFELYPKYEQSMCDFELSLYNHYQQAFNTIAYMIFSGVPLPESIADDTKKSYPKTATILISGGQNVTFLDQPMPELYVIPSGETYEYVAHEAIILKPGFHAKAGSNFTARIEPCADCTHSYTRKDEQIEYTTDNAIKSQGNIIEEYLNIYPNPTDGALYVQTSREVARIELYGLSGEKLLESRETTLDLHGLQEGMYVLMVHFADGTVHSEKVIRNQ